MEKLKIRVNSSDESKEVQYLFEVIGYEKGACSLGNYPAIIVTIQDWATGDYCSTRALGLDIPAHDQYKEITLPELRDMVVLKRNDVADATHESSIYKYFKGCDDWYYFDLGCTDKWKKSAGAKPEYYEKLKPIEKKEMKEYLNKETYAYVKTHDLVSKDSNWIEVPEGAEIAIQFKNNSNEHGVIFYKAGGKSCIGENDNSWQHDSEWTMDQLLNENYHDGDIDLSHWIIWQRTPSLNDQYAEIEQVHQASKDNVNHPGHYTQGKVECIDALESATIGKSGIEAVCVANVIKYLWRYEDKNGLEDVKKAQWYLERLVASMDS